MAPLQTKWEATADSEKPAAIAIVIGAVVAQIAIGATVEAVVSGVFACRAMVPVPLARHPGWTAAAPMRRWTQLLCQCVEHALQDRLPLVKQFLEFVGLAVTGVYGYRYFTDPAER